MRKLAFFSVISVLFLADFGAFGAAQTSPRTRGGSQVSSQKVLGQQTSARTGATAVRSATAARSAVKKAPTNSANAARAAVSTPRGTVARAGTQQKAIIMGTKVETANENTVVSEECRTAFYGCMDAFCMLDSAAGGRCQCSDRVADLNLVLDEIMRLDEQSLAMATEGVERLQMGENAEEIMARAKAAADSVTSKTNTNIARDSASNSKKTRTLDLSGWRNNNLFDDFDGDVFGDENKSATDIDLSLADKTGDELQGAAAKICVERIPDQCKNSASFLHLTYAQKVKSDCTAYENSLKQQRTASAEKLQNAQKALRDTALEMYQNENKYDLGQCVARFKQCMQTTAECGEDYSGCVADTAILGELYKKGGSSNSGHKVPTTVIKTGATSITISSATYDILNVKKDMCASVTKQCVNANKKNAVWSQVIKDLAPAVYTAEYNAASNNRMNCINTVVTCVQNVCASKWDEETDNYDACLSDPKSIDNYCGLEYRRCGDDASEGSVRSYVMAKLAALKVDKCTKDVKECLLSEDRCGPDYENCVGLDTDTIVDLCPEDKLLSCQNQEKGRTAENVREYIAQIAQGIALNIDNKFATVCQNAVDAAYARVCGVELDDEYYDEEDGSGDVCPKLNVSNYEAKGNMKWEYCIKDTNTCESELALFTNEDIKSNLVVPTITGKLGNLGTLHFDAKGCDGSNNSNDGGSASESSSYFCMNGASDEETKLLNIMNRDYKFIMDQIASDSTVKNCREGRSLQGISSSRSKTNGKTFGRDSEGETELQGRFVNILNTAESEISSKVINSVLADYYDELNSLKNSGKSEEMYQAISERKLQIIAAELTRKLMQGKDLCDLSGEEFATLLANEEAQKSLKQAQDETNRATCEENIKENNYMAAGWKGDGDEMVIGTATEYREVPNFCSKPKGYAGAAKKNDVCPNGNAGTRTYRKTPSYDPTTNTCNVKIETFDCKKTGTLRKWKNRCKQWDVNNPDNVETKVYQMPEWNDRGSQFIKEDCNKGKWVVKVSAK